jgi:hypothetical protein
MSLARCHPNRVVEVPLQGTRIARIRGIAEKDPNSSFVKPIAYSPFWAVKEGVFEYGRVRNF